MSLKLGISVIIGEAVGGCPPSMAHEIIMEGLHPHSWAEWAGVLQVLRRIVQLLQIWLALGLFPLNLGPLMLLSCMVALGLERARTPVWGLISDRELLFVSPTQSHPRVLASTGRASQLHHAGWAGGCCASLLVMPLVF